MSKRRAQHPEAMTAIQEGLVTAVGKASEAFTDSLTDAFFIALITIEQHAEERGFRDGFKRGLDARARGGKSTDRARPEGDGDWRADARAMAPPARRQR